MAVRGPALAAAIGTLLLLLAPTGAGAAALEPVGSFESPIFVTSAPDDPERLLVAERKGVIREKAGADAPVPFADISGWVECCESERGLLSIAVPEDFPASGRLYAAYTGTAAAGGAVGDIHVDAFRHQGGALVREPMLTIGHSANKNHNGGQLQLGPDGRLYVSVGDGGGGGDPLNSGQDLDTLLGKLLRIEPRPEEGSYAIPAGNPFAAAAGRDEIWAYGLRNPWRFSFDRAGGDLIVADVGQGAREEVNLARSPAPGSVGGAGANYGWDCREGLLPYTGPPDSPSPDCAGAGGFADPVFDYPHSSPGGGGAFGCSITGGYVIRDPSLGGLYGRYLYADFCQGQIRSLQLPAAAGGVATGDRSEGLVVASPVSFGEDSCGRIYVASNGGTVYRLVGDEPADCGAEGEPEPEPEPSPGPGPGPPTPEPLPGPPIRPLATPGTGLPRLLLRAAGAEGAHVRITVRARPCSGHAGRRVQLRRGGRGLASGRLDVRCVARFRVSLEGRSTFRAVLRLGPLSVRSERLVARGGIGRPAFSPRRR